MSIPKPLRLRDWVANTLAGALVALAVTYVAFVIAFAAGTGGAGS